MAWHPGLADWVPLRDFPFLERAASSESHPMPAPLPYWPMPVQAPQISVETTTSVLAVASLILSLLSLAITPFPAFICGWLAKSEIRQNPALGGKRLAQAGILIAWFFLFVYLLLLLALALPWLGALWLMSTGSSGGPN